MADEAPRVDGEDLGQLIEEAEAELGNPEEKVNIGRRGFIARTLKWGTVALIAAELGLFSYYGNKVAAFFENNKYAARMVENIALESELISEHSGIGEGSKRAKQILARNETLKAEYQRAIAEAKAAQFQMANTQLQQTLSQTVQLFEEWQQIHDSFTGQFESDQGDFGLLAKRSKAIAFDTVVNLDSMLAEIQSGTADSLVETQRSIYTWIGEATGVEGLKYDPEKIKAFKKKYQAIVDIIKEIQANKKQIASVDSRFRETRDGDQVGHKYRPWMDYCERRGQLEKTYLGLRKTEDRMHEIPDYTRTREEVKAYKSQVDHWHSKAKELDVQINANVESARQYTGQEITSQNQFDDFKRKLRYVIYGGTALAAVVTAAATAYAYRKVADWTGHNMARVTAAEQTDLAKRQEARLTTRRGILGRVLPFLKHNPLSE